MTTHSDSSTWSYDESKLTELILYVAKELFGKTRNGSIKLNKILFFSDAYSYALTGKPITGVGYIRRRFGPAPRGIVEIQNRLSAAGEVEVLVFPGFERSQTILFPKRSSDLSKFSASEIKLVDLVIETFSDMKTEDVSELSHTLDGWKVAREGEEIPYEAIFLYSGPLTESDVQMGLDIESRLSAEIDERLLIPA